eukprot:8064619-Pyramimonas_sp.AAC.1
MGAPRRRGNRAAASSAAPERPQGVQAPAEGEPRPAWESTDTRYGLGQRDVEQLDRMLIQWAQALMPALARLALRHEPAINFLEAVTYRRAQVPAKRDVAKFHGAE